MPRGGQVKKALRKQIRDLFNSGETLVSIAEKLGKAPSTIAYHVRALGVPPIKHFRALPLKDGKRKCVECLRWKVADSFPSGANPVCTKCNLKTREGASDRNPNSTRGSAKPSRNAKAGGKRNTPS